MNLTIDELEDVVVAENAFVIHGDEEGLGEVHGCVVLGELDKAVLAQRQKPIHTYIANSMRERGSILPEEDQ